MPIADDKYEQALILTKQLIKDLDEADIFDEHGMHACLSVLMDSVLRHSESTAGACFLIGDAMRTAAEMVGEKPEYIH